MLDGFLHSAAVAADSAALDDAGRGARVAGPEMPAAALGAAQAGRGLGLLLGGVFAQLFERLAGFVS